MNTQGHSSLPYNITLCKVFFGRKYRDRDNSPATPTEVGLGPVNVTDEWINDKVSKRFSIIDKVITKFLEYEDNK